MDQPQLLASLAEVARQFSSAPDRESALDSIVSAAATLLPDIDHVGISLAHSDGTIETPASSSEFAAKLDTIQADLGDGPCVYAAEAETIVRVEPARHEQRWPRFISAAVPLGLRSMLGMRLLTDDKSMGALNLYSTKSDTISQETTHLADLFAAQAAVALGWLRREDELTNAMESRRIIGVALGIVMKQFEVDDARAFRYLTRLSNNRNVKLREVAAELVDEHNRRVANGG